MPNGALAMRIYREEHPEYVEISREISRRQKARTADYAYGARRDLRSLMQLGPRTTRLIERHINIWSASDARVAQFHRRLMMEIKHGYH